MKRVILIRHDDTENDDRAYQYLHRNGFVPVVVRPFAGEKMRPMDGSVAGSVVYGGPYNAYDTGIHPFLKEEYRWIDECLKAEIPLLGLCQGSQQIAFHLGATAGPIEGEPYEFGYYPIYPEPGAEDFLSGPMVVTQSHFHMSSVPAGAKLLAHSDLFATQAFSYGDRVFGLQFHPEVTPAGFRRWQDAPWAHFGKPGAQSREEQDRLMGEHDDRQATWFEGFLHKLFGTS